jgi:hypothetical protein
VLTPFVLFAGLQSLLCPWSCYRSPRQGLVSGACSSWSSRSFLLISRHRSGFSCRPVLDSATTGLGFRPVSHSTAPVSCARAGLVCRRFSSHAGCWSVLIFLPLSPPACGQFSRPLLSFPTKDLFVCFPAHDMCFPLGFFAWQVSYHRVSCRAAVDSRFSRCRPWLCFHRRRALLFCIGSCFLCRLGPGGVTELKVDSCLFRCSFCGCRGCFVL